MKLTVLGPGCWGLTLAWLLNDNFEDITIELDNYNFLNLDCLPLEEADSQKLKEVIETIEKIVPCEKYTNMYGKTRNLKELADMISGAEMFLCSDSAPLHVAVALGVKTFVIFGSTDDKKLIPDNGLVIPIKAKNCKCPLQPCLWERRQTTCETLDCLNISADEIVDVIMEN